jgi:hypothetical protein
VHAQCLFLFGTPRAELSHDEPRISLTDMVSILFESQKRDKQNETITQHRTGDPLLCPVRMWATIVQRVRSYLCMTENTTVNTFHFEGKKTKIQGSTAFTHLRAASRTIGRDRLGFGPEDVGLRSIHSGADMAMYLGVVTVFLIIMVGHWRSDAFLYYIQQQVQEFSTSVSAQMV